MFDEFFVVLPIVLDIATVEVVILVLLLSEAAIYRWDEGCHEPLLRE